MSHPNVDPNELMAAVEDGLQRPDGQDPVIGALEILAEMREMRAVPLFKEALGHRNIGTRTGAALGLYRCGNPEGLKALTAWASAIETDSTGAVQAVYALAKIKNAAAIDALRKLQSEHGTYSVMFRGQQRSVSWIVDSLLGTPHEAAPAPSSGTGTDAGFKAAQKAASGCFTVVLGVAGFVGAAIVIVRSL